jgi:hypothetical protein
MIFKASKGMNMKLGRGFLLLEFALALTLLSIAVVVTLHLVNDMAVLYREVTVSTSLLRAVQTVGEGGGHDQRSEVQGSEVTVYPWPHTGDLVPGHDIFSWIMHQVSAYKIVAHEHGRPSKNLEITVIDENPVSGVYPA